MSLANQRRAVGRGGRSGVSSRARMLRLIGMAFAAGVALASSPASARQLAETYYEWVGVETLPGYSAEFGEPDALAGISENGRFMWSQAAADPTDPDEPYLVIDHELHYLWEFEGLSALLVNAINSDGLILATALEDDQERVLVTHIQSLAARTYLDELALTGDAGLDPAIAVPVALTDAGAVLVRTPVPGSALVQLWIVRDDEVSRLWQADPALTHAEHDWEHLAYARLFIDANATDTVIGYRALSEPDIRPMLWSPQTGVMELAALSQVASINDDGTIFAKEGDRLVLWRDGDSEWTGYADGTRDGDFGSGWAPAGRAADGVRLVTHVGRGRGGSARITQTFLSAKSPYDPVTLLEEEERPIDSPATITDAGIVLDGRAGWFDPIDTADAVTAIGGARAFMWVNEDGSSITTLARRDRKLSIAPRSYRPSWSLGDSWAGNTDRFAGDVFESQSGVQYLVYRDQTGLQLSGAGRQESWAEADMSPRVTGFVLPNGFMVAAGTTEAGELRLVYDSSVQYIYKDGAYYTQGRASLTEHLARRGLPTPAFASNLDSFITPWGAMNIVGLDADGDLHAVWWSPALRSPLWTTDNLSALTGAPKLVGNISANATRWNGMQVFGTDERGHLIVVWWSPASDGWRWDDLTAETDGTPINPGTLASVVTPWGAIEAVAISVGGEVATYWWTPRSGGWVYESITARLVDEVPPIAGPLSLALGPDGSQHIAGVSAEGQVIHLSWRPDGQHLWRAENLSALAAR